MSLAGYKRWVRKHGWLVKKYEEVIRTAALFLPVRHGDGELVSEATYSITNLLGMYNDHLLCTADSTDQAGLPATAQSGSSGASAGDGHVSKLTQGLRWSLTVLANVQVVAEMLTYRRGDAKSKWNMIVFIELLRAALKTAVLMRSRSGVLLNGGRVVPPVPPASALAEPGAEEDQGAGDEADALMNMLGGKGGEDEGPAVPNRPQRWWKGSRSGTKLPLPLNFPTELETDSTDKVEQTWLLAGEALNIARPVVYTVTRRIFGGKSWIPVLASLGTDLASWQCSRRGTAMFGGSQPPETGPVAGGLLFKALMWLATPTAECNPHVAAEMSRRKWLWGYYLLRSPLFEVGIKACADKTMNIASYIPLFGVLVRYLRDVLLYFQRIYFYVAGSS